LKDATGALTVHGYVTFSTHEEAAGLIAAFPVDDEEGNIQSTWSLSERLRSGIDGPLGADVCSIIEEGLRAVQAEVGCTAIALVGDRHLTMRV